MSESWTNYVLSRDDHTCAYCGGKADRTEHVVPTNVGGTDEPTNLIAVCGTCQDWSQ